MAKSKKAVAKKKTTKKPAPVKAAAKKSVKKTAKKPAVKKTVKKAPAAKKPVAKKAVKKAAPKKAASVKAVVTKTAPQKIVPAKKIDLSRIVTPLDDRVMVQIVEREKMTAGGLYIPGTVADFSGNLQGFVVSVGRGHRNKKGHVRPMDLQVGDKVLFSEYSGSKIKIEDQDLLILREADVLGVVG